MDAPSPISTILRKRRRVLERLARRAGPAHSLRPPLGMLPCVAVCSLGDGAVVAAHELTPSLRMWKSLSSACDMIAMPSAPHSLHWGPHGLIAAMTDCLQLLDAASLEPTWSTALTSVDSHASQALICAVDPSGSIQLFDTRRGRASIGSVTFEEASFARFAVNSLVTCTQSGEAKVFDLRTSHRQLHAFACSGPPALMQWNKGKFEPAFKRHTGAVAGICVTDGNVVITAGAADGALKAWNEGRCVGTWRTGALRAHSPSPGERGTFFAAINDEERGVGVGEFAWNEPDGPLRVLKRQVILPSETCVAWDGEEGRLVAGQLQGGVTVWDRER